MKTKDIAKTKNFTETIRITSGIFRGRELKSPGIKSTHPMGSRERLALFNSLGENLKNAVILDAFAGTGALGFEALSRGAAHVTFIEKNRKAAAAISENIKLLNLEQNTRLLVSKVETLKFSEQFDIVIADPPYDYFDGSTGSAPKLSVTTLNRLASSAKTAFILSHPANFDPHVISVTLKSTKSYAGARISIFAA